MNIHEYQAKALLRSIGAPVADGCVIMGSDDLSGIAGLSGAKWVVKAQIHAGGRGKGRFLEAEAGHGGGVRVHDSVSDAQAECRRMLGHRLVTKQTGAAGRVVRRVYVERGVEIERELYLAMLLDRAASRVAYVCSTEGGMDIEEVAATQPDKIATIHVDPATGVQPHHGRRVARALGLSGKQIGQCVALASGLYGLFLDTDAELIEINPLIVDGKGDLLCLDCKMSFDDNALARQPDIRALRDESEIDPKELAAAEFDLSYIALDGQIGCMVNGAGLAMATMDIIKLHGGEPANFLDVGGGASRDKVVEAFKIITGDPNVAGILVNIFGGIMRCDVIAEGIVAAIREVGMSVPLVVRLEGTNVELGKTIIDDSGLNMISATDLDDAARKIVAAVVARG